MKNYWVQKDFRIAAWHADVTPLLNNPEALLALVRAVYAAGAEQNLLIPVETDVAEVAARRWTAERVLDVFRLARSTPMEAHLAWYDSSDTLVEGRVRDLGELLERLQPNEGCISSYNRERGEAPVSLTGGQIRYVANAPQRADSYPETFTISLYSDIWFPYVMGFAHPAVDLERFFDNRELAERNTPRLNRMLAKIARLVTDAGGGWYIDEEDRAAMYAPWLSSEGIVLDGPAPALVPTSAVGIEWPTLED